jgi:4-hydroxyacetophenone monooxygenase
VSTSRDEAFVRAAVGQADLNALRMALYQATGDAELAAIQLVRPSGGSGTNGSTLIVEIGADDVPIVQEKAVRFLLEQADGFVPELPDDIELRRLMELLRGETLNDTAFAYGRDVIAFEEFPREARWSAGRPELPQGFTVAIVGGGFSGIATAVQLTRLGIPFTLYERRHDVGGTWNINTYPDARVDTTNFMYQFSFEKNYPWSEYFARQDEVRRYLAHIVQKFDLAPHIRFGADVARAVFDEATSTWRLTIVGDDGSAEDAVANVVVSCAGLFSTPRRLEVPGVDEFEGTILHTTEWLGDLDLGGTRVAVIGNGSTGVQLLGRIAQAAEHVTVFQRTPQWIAPRPRYGDPISPESRWLLDTMPYYGNWYIYSMLAEGVGIQALQEPDPEWQARGGLINEQNDALRATMTAYIRSQLPGRPDLVAKVTPSHAPMARRLIVDNHWYETLLRPDAELVTEAIERITPTGIRTADGVERPVDVIVSATGFSTTKYLFPAEYVGVGGRTLEEAWAADGPRAHLGLTVPGFPNLFILYGPNAQPRAGSVVSIMEQWASYAAQAVIQLLEGGHARVEVRADVFDDYNRRLDAYSKGLIWVDSGSIEKNYYVNRFGRSQVNEPWPIEEYYRMILHPDPAHFTFS